MTDISVMGTRKRFLFAWVPDVFFHPRRAFQRITSSPGAVWLTPLLILSTIMLINVLISGRIKSQAALSGEITYPPDFQYYSAEQQAQYMQAIQSKQGPVFVYVLPVITSLLGVWFAWLILGGTLHLVTTMFGGRGNTSVSMNIVAWAGLPLALRGLIQIIYILITKQLISNPGLSGFSPPGESGWPLFFSKILMLIDIYIIWQVILIILGVGISTGLSVAKSTFTVLLTFIILLLLKSGLSYLVSLLGNLPITRPFFF